MPEAGRRKDVCDFRYHCSPHSFAIWTEGAALHLLLAFFFCTFKFFSLVSFSCSLALWIVAKNRRSLLGLLGKTVFFLSPISQMICFVASSKNWMHPMNGYNLWRDVFIPQLCNATKVEVHRGEYPFIAVIVKLCVLAVTGHCDGHCWFCQWLASEPHRSL